MYVNNIIHYSEDMVLGLLNGNSTLVCSRESSDVNGVKVPKALRPSLTVVQCMHHEAER